MLQVPLKKIFSKSMSDKFPWALEVPETWRFDENLPDEAKIVRRNEEAEAADADTEADADVDDEEVRTRTLAPTCRASLPRLVHLLNARPCSSPFPHRSRCAGGQTQEARSAPPCDGIPQYTRQAPYKARAYHPQRR